MGPFPSVKRDITHESANLMMQTILVTLQGLPYQKIIVAKTPTGGGGCSILPSITVFPVSLSLYTLLEFILSAEIW